MQQEQYIHMVEAYLGHALRRLRITEGALHIRYVDAVAAPCFIVLYNPTTKCIEVNNANLKMNVDTHQVTPIQLQTYQAARLAYQHLNGLQADTLDAIAFSYALATIKGVAMEHFLPLHQELIPRYKELLKQEFGMDVEMVLAIDIQGKPHMVVKLTGEEDEKLKLGIESIKEYSSVKQVPAVHSGTKDDPFENIDEACAYIKRLEAAAYNNDELMKQVADEDYFYDGTFRYPFASPHVTYYKSDFPEDCFIVNQNAPHNKKKCHFVFKPNLYRRKFLFRGQKEDYAPKPCVPNLYRNPEQNYFIEEMVSVQELELLLMSHPLVNQLERGVELLHDHFSFYMNRRGLAQHYYHKTSFLDFSSELDVAKFFASTGYDSSSDNYFPIVHEEKLGVIYCYELTMPSPFQPQADGSHLSVIGKQLFMRSGAQHGFLLDMPRGVDLKTMPKVRAIYFKHDEAISERIFKESGDGQRFFAIDILEKAWKEEYKYRMDHKIVSEDAVWVNVSRNAGSTFESISSELLRRGYTIDKLKPHFSPALLAEYYQNIKNGWWEDFCSDIYFSGADGVLYKNALSSLPCDTRYEHAFKG